MRGALRAIAGWIYRMFISFNHVIVEAVLEIPRPLESEEALRIGFVVAEQQFGTGLDVQSPDRKLGMRRLDGRFVEHSKERPLRIRRP